MITVTVDRGHRVAVRQGDGVVALASVDRGGRAGVRHLDGVVAHSAVDFSDNICVADAESAATRTQSNIQRG